MAEAEEGGTDDNIRDDIIGTDEGMNEGMKGPMTTSGALTDVGRVLRKGIREGMREKLKGMREKLKGMQQK